MVRYSSSAGGCCMNAYDEVNTMLNAPFLYYPAIDRALAIKVANRIYRHFGNKKFAAHPERFRRPKCTENNVRRCWVAKAGVNDLSKGWRRLIHDTSHRLFTRRYPEKRPHDSLHAALEREVAQFVISAYLRLPAVLANDISDAMRKDQQAKKRRALRVDKLNRLEARIVNWERKARRAETALKRLRKEHKQMLRRLEIKL